ncbi:MULTISPECIES: M23 family metallopeptidase [unclassified Streptomyces]|uniref:M23 family metallopeptidase n=1 Tax=unclassified Streptomyces TaxID=2593676 RepID=UPI003808A494
MASNEPALIPGQQQQTTGYANPEWDTAEWNMAAGWNPPATEQTPPTKNAIDGWDTAEWNFAAGWVEEALAAAPEPAAEPVEPVAPFTPVAPVPEPRSAVEAAAFLDEAYGVREAAPAHEADTRDTNTAQPLPPYGEPEPATEPWNPTEESTAPVRGRHRVAKQRTLGRGSAVFGVAAVAVLGVGGVATAEGKNPLPVSLPKLPEVSKVPGIGGLLESEPTAKPVAQALTPGAGEALRARILDQAQQQRNAADHAARTAAQQEAAAKAAKAAAAQQVRVEAAAKKKAAEEAAKKAEAARLAELAKSYTLPLTSYTLTASFGQSSSLWANTHTGQDFAAPTGTPAKAIHSGTITEAGWAGSYGYRIILTLDDGTELWYCHLSSMLVTSGKVSTGDTIGRVGATGNVTGPHLHIEVRPGGGDPIDPMPWLRSMGMKP